MKKFLIRVDASRRIGSGHLTRTTALGQMLQDMGFQSHFATVPHVPQTTERLRSEGFEVHLLPAGADWDPAADARELMLVAEQVRPDWLVLDGYQFDTSYQRAVTDPQRSLMCIDDLAAFHFVSDVLLNQNYGADRFQYSTDEGCRRLLGLDYVLLRREFREMDVARKLHPQRVKKLLITLGGGTPSGQRSTVAILRALETIADPELTVRVVMGGLAEQGPEPVIGPAGASARVEVLRSTDNMAAEMTWAECAITSGGSTMWELIRARVPFLGVATSAAQVGYLQFLSDEGACGTLGDITSTEAPVLSARIREFLEAFDVRRNYLRRTAAWIDPERTIAALAKAFAS